MLSIDYTKDLLNLQEVIVDKMALPKAVTTKLKYRNEMPTVIETLNDFGTEYCICLITKSTESNKKKWTRYAATQFCSNFFDLNY